MISKSFVAEVIGTFALVFIGAGAVIVESHTGMSHMGLPDGKVGLIGIAFAHGLTLMGVIYAMGSLSGAHVNPAVSFAFWLQRKISTSTFTAYLVAQFAGCLGAALLLAAIFPDEISLASLGTPSLAPKISALKGIAIEAVITFLLVTTVLFSTRGEKADTRFAGVAIGGSLVGLILFAGPLTGAAANPARFLGPALVARQLGEIWVYMIGPAVGGGLASITFGFLAESAQVAVPAPARAGDSVVATDEGEAVSVRVESASPTGGNDVELLETARKLNQSGKSKEAAAVLLPTLSRFDRLSAELRNSIRTLLIVIEEDTGPLGFLDESRHLIYPRSSATKPLATS